MAINLENSFFIQGPAGKLEARSAKFSGEQAQSDIIGIVCHPHPLYKGTMDNKVVTTIVKAWIELGLATIRFNFRGVEKSEGQYGEGKGEIMDLHAILQWVMQNNPNKTIWLAGFSFGSAVAFQGALSSQVQALLTVAPPVNHFDFINKDLNENKNTNNRIINCPWIIIHGDQDEVVPINEVEALVEKVKLQKDDIKFIVMHGASHFFHQQLIELKNNIIDAMKPLT